MLAFMVVMAGIQQLSTRAAARHQVEVGHNRTFDTSA
jgi:hypothetical protein